MSKARVLWLHTQPEHYFNLMVDDLNRASDLEYVSAFLYKGPGLYQEAPLPRVGPAIILRARPGMSDRAPNATERYHLDWRADLEPLGFSAAIVPGYAGRTQREVRAWCHGRGIPLAMFSDSNLRGERQRGRLKRCLKHLALRRITGQVDYVLTANRLGVAYWRYYGAGDKVLRCPYYADYRRIAEAAAVPREAALAPFGIDPGAKMILSSARLVPVKGLDLMLRAFVGSGLAERGWIYALAGRGPLEAELKALAGDQLDKSVRFLGFVQPRELLALTRHAALFVLPSNFEPHGIVIQEALAAGTPVLASHVCGAAFDLVEEGVSGWMFRAGDAGDLAKKLAIAADEGRLAAMRSGARAVFDAWFAATNPVRIVDELAHRMLAGRANGGGKP